MKSFVKVRIKESQCSPCIQRLLLRLVVPVFLTFMFWRSGLWFLGSFFLSWRRAWWLPFSSHQRPLAFYRFLSICHFHSDIALIPKHPQIFLVRSQYVFLFSQFVFHLWNLFTFSIAKGYDITGVYYLQSLSNLHPCSRDLQNVTATWFNFEFVPALSILFCIDMHK